MLVQTHTSYFMFNKRMEKGKLKTESYCVVMRTGTKLYFLRMYSSSVTGFWKCRFPSPLDCFWNTSILFLSNISSCADLSGSSTEIWSVSLTNSSSLRGVCLLIKRIQKHLPYSRQVNTTIILSLDSLQPSPQISFTKDGAGPQWRNLPGSTRKQQLRAHVMFFPFTQSRNFNN